MPWVRVTDLVIHPRDNDLVVATYGRGLYITNISPLEELSDAVLAEDFHFFDIEPRTLRVYGGMGNYQLLGDSHLLTPNEPNAVAVSYYLKAKAADAVKVTVSDLSGNVVNEIKGGTEAGINTVFWFMEIRRPGGEARRPDEDFFRSRQMADPGEYLVTIEAAGKKLVKKAVIRKRQGWTVGPVPVEIR
jgi:hypothetical protein